MASFLDLFSVADSDGVSATRYRLHYLGNSLVNQDSWIFGMLTEMLYMLFQLIIVPANALLGFVLNSASWLDPLAGFYQRLTAPLFALFPPWALACLGLGLVAFSALKSRPNSTIGGLDGETANRVGGALAMATAVLVLTNNPFAMVAKLLELANGFSLGLAGAVTRNGDGSLLTAGQSLVDSSIRTPTIALNYGSEMTAACRSQWSQAMLAGKTLTEDSGCFTHGANTAGPGSLSTAVLMLLLPALPMLVFCVVAAWKYLLHLSMSALCLLATGWVAAISVHKRRGFEKLSKAFAHAASHLVMAVLTSMLAVALPVTCAGLGTELLGLVASPQTQAYVLMVSLGIGFAVSAWAILKLTSNHGVLVRALKADANANLEKLFGVTPKKFEFGFANVGTLLRGGKVPEDGGASAKAPSAGGRSVLSKNPVATASPGDPGSGAQPGSTESQDVTQLMAAAQSVADSASAPTTSPTTTAVNTPMSSGNAGAVATVVSAPMPADTTTAAEPPAVGVAQSTATAPADAGVQAPREAPVGVSPPGDEPHAVQERLPVTIDSYGFWFEDRAQTAERTNDVDAVSGRPAGAPEPAEPEGTPVLAQFGVPPSVRANDNAPAPVSGLAGADPALESAARSAGVTFTAAPRPEPQRRISTLLRRFSRGPIAPAPHGAVPEVEYGPPLSAAAEGSDHFTGVADPTEKEAGVVNDQQRWNRLRRVRSVFRGDVTSPAERTDSAAGADNPGVRPHPGAYQAPMPDFLAGDALASEIDEVTVTSGAAGAAVDVKIRLDDRRLGLQLSSDPDERLRSSNPPGFGDPQ